MHISPYSHGNRFNHEPTRTRKLMLHKDEIRRLVGKTREQGLTLIPLRVYFNEQGWAKVELALARGKKKWDKREAMARTGRAAASRTGHERPGGPLTSPPSLGGE